MEGKDNIMSILKSITPIKYKFSKKNREFDKTFKTMSLQNLMKSLDYHPKLQDEFAPSPEFLNNKNKYEINFKNSNEYIKELSDLNNLPLVVSNKNCLKDGKFNEDFDIDPLSNKEEKMKVLENKEKRKKERLEEKFKRFKILKEDDSNVDSLKYNPNYDFIRKKIYSVHIRPPTPKKVKQAKIENEKNSEKKRKNFLDSNNITNQNNNQTQNIKQNLNQNSSIITFDKSKTDLINNNINSSINSIRNSSRKDIGSNKNINNSIIFNESNTNRSNSSKMRFPELNNQTQII